MPNTNSRSLAWMFVLTGANILALGYSFATRYPLRVGAFCAVGLAALAWWYAGVRGAAERVRLRTIRYLVFTVAVGVVIVSVLHRVLPAP